MLSYFLLSTDYFIYWVYIYSYSNEMLTAAIHRGIIMCAGGVTYLTNAYIAIRLLRHHDCDLPVEIWYQDESEVDERSKALFNGLDVTFHSSRDEALSRNLPPPTGWALKPFAILHSAFDELLYLDSDNFVVRDPAYLFDCREFQECGAVFWPDLQKSSPYNRVWEMLGLHPRDEWEFESGQILVKKSECLEPLRFALQMNYEADRYYQHIWGDKDTFRFAWHKSGRRFAMPSTGVELLTAADGPKNGGVMCQHDFEGRRVFQHRNILKWQLFGNNPHVAGFFHEPLCRQFLSELREEWDGRLHSDREQDEATGKKIAEILAGKAWLISGVGRSRATGSPPRTISTGCGTGASPSRGTGLRPRAARLIRAELQMASARAAKRSASSKTDGSRDSKAWACGIGTLARDGWASRSAFTETGTSR